jgi:hypothetical protein
VRMEQEGQEGTETLLIRLIVFGSYGLVQLSNYSCRSRALRSRVSVNAMRPC